MTKKLLITLASLILLSPFAYCDVSDETMPITYTCDASAVDFSFAFSIENTSDIYVIVKVTATGVPTTLTETTDYSVTATNNDFSSGGTVTTVATYAATQTIIIGRSTPATQGATFRDAGVLRLAAITESLDKLTRIYQEVQEQLDRSIHFPRGETGTSEVDNSIDRALKYAGFDASGNATTFAGTTSTNPVSASMTPVVSAATLALARDEMGLRRGAINVLDYGVVADGDGAGGGTDQTAAIQVIFDNTAINNDIYFPAGQYQIDSSLTIPRDCTIRGAGAKNTIFEYTAATGDGFQLGAARVQNIINLKIYAINDSTGAGISGGTGKTALTSGVLVSGNAYRIDDWKTDDDFVNVGGANVDGTEFIATGTTPTKWTNSSIVTPIAYGGDIFIDRYEIEGFLKGIYIPFAVEVQIGQGRLLGQGKAVAGGIGCQLGHLTIAGIIVNTTNIEGCYASLYETGFFSRGSIHNMSYCTIENADVAYTLAARCAVTGSWIQADTTLFNFLSGGWVVTSTGNLLYNGANVEQEWSSAMIVRNGGSFGLLNGQTAQIQNLHLSNASATGNISLKMYQGSTLRTFLDYQNGVGTVLDGDGSIYLNPGNTRTAKFYNVTGSIFGADDTNNVTITPAGAMSFNGTASLAGIQLLGTATLNVQSAAQTTIYTVPAGKRCVLDHIKIVSGAVASPTAVVTFGQQGAATDFLGAQTFTNLAAQYDTIICAPVPNATPVKTKSYAAATVIQADVTTADVDGGTDNTVYIFGTLY